MKLFVKGFLIISAMIFNSIILGCANDSGSSLSGNSKFDASASGSLLTATESTIIKNKVVNLNGSEDVYYEYLKFTSETGGEYSIYKQEEELVLQSSFNGSAVPSTFTYDSTNGKVTVGSNQTYMFSAGSDFGVAKTICTSTESETDKLFQKWTVSPAISVIFNDIGTICFTNSTGDFGSEYSNNGGWISTANGLGFCWIKILNEMKLYYMAYKTERKNVEEVGRAALNEEFNFESSNFLFLK